MSRSPQPPIVRQQSSESAFAPIGDLRAYVQIVKRRKWSLLLVVVLSLGLTVFISTRQTPMYRSDSTVLVKPLNPNQILQGYSYNLSVSMQTEQTLATSPEVAAIASGKAKTLGDHWGDTGSVSTKIPQDTTFLELDYSATDPEQARVWSQAYALGYIEYRREQALNLYNSAQAGFEQKISEVNAHLRKAQAEYATTPSADVTTRQKLKAEISADQNNMAVLTRQAGSFPFPVAETAAQLISPASLPAAPYSPNWSRNLITALLAGMALGFALVFVRERLDDRLAGREDLEEQAGAPVLAIVPKVPSWGKKSNAKLIARDAPKTAAAEAYRTLRTNISFMARTNDLKLIAIASPSMSEGKTTTTANLAVALAHSGKRVIAVSCDLRKPRLHRFFGISNERGLTSVLRDELGIPEVAQRIDGIDTLRVIASGPVPHNPAELLGSEDMELLLQDLRNYADFILVDTAPVLVVSDALTVAPKTDGVVLLVDASGTMRGAVRATREQLELVGSNIVGAVFNNFDPARAKMYPGSYRYHYYGSDQYKDAPGAEEPRSRRTPVDPTEIWR